MEGAEIFEEFVVDSVDVDDVNLIRINIFRIQSRRKMLPNKIVIQQKIHYSICTLFDIKLMFSEKATKI